MTEMDVGQVTLPKIPQKVRPRLTHACGWEKDKGLCGAAGKTPPREELEPIVPDCVVCWDIWMHMSFNERARLWDAVRGNA